METKEIVYKRILAYKHVNAKAHTKCKRSISLALKFTPSYTVWDEMIHMKYDSDINVNLGQIVSPS